MRTSATDGVEGWLMYNVEMLEAFVVVSWGGGFEYVYVSGKDLGSGVGVSGLNE